MVEMALVLPLLCLLVFGICDFGILMFRQTTATHCVREIARRAAVWGSTAVTGCGGYPVTLSPSCASRQPGQDVTATIDLLYDWVVLDNLVPDGALDGTKIKATATMRLEPKKTSTVCSG